MSTTVHDLAGATIVGVSGADSALLCALDDAAFARLLAPGARYDPGGTDPASGFTIWDLVAVAVHSLAPVGGGVWAAFDSTGARITDRGAQAPDRRSAASRPTLPTRAGESLAAPATLAGAFLGQRLAVEVGGVWRVGRLTATGSNVLLPDGSVAPSTQVAATVVSVAPGASLVGSDGRSPVVVGVHSTAPDGGVLLGSLTEGRAPRTAAFVVEPTIRTAPPSTLGGLAATPRTGASRVAVQWQSTDGTSPARFLVSPWT